MIIKTTVMFMQNNSISSKKSTVKTSANTADSKTQGGISLLAASR